MPETFREYPKYLYPRGRDFDGVLVYNKEEEDKILNPVILTKPIETNGTLNKIVRQPKKVI